MRDVKRGGGKKNKNNNKKKQSVEMKSKSVVPLFGEESNLGTGILGEAVADFLEGHSNDGNELRSSRSRFHLNFKIGEFENTL